MSYSGKGWTLYLGDCLAVLPSMPESSVDAVVTDPPYELGFMGKAWDASGIAYRVDLWRAVLRVLKPGGHLLAFGGTRTYHRMTCAIEDAGFEIRDSLHWIYGSGFPKSVNVSIAIDKATGAMGHRGKAFSTSVSHHQDVQGTSGAALFERHEGITDAAKQWAGWGTALKPGHEPIVLARKPLVGTVAANVQRFGTGALNVGACRIGTGEGKREAWSVPGKTRRDAMAGGAMVAAPTDTTLGRWPANVLLDEGAAAELDGQSGTLTSGARSNTANARFSGSREGGAFKSAPACGASEGGASRFFYVAKPSRAERDMGCGDLEPRSGGKATDREDDTEGLKSPRAGAGRNGGARNYHPTVKPVELMRYLVKLITPPRGVVLDPFLGSGTTAAAAWLEFRDFIGIEISAEYLEIAKRRAVAREAQGELFQEATG